MSLNVELASGFCSLPVISDNKKMNWTTQTYRQVKRKTDIGQKDKQTDRRNERQTHVQDYRKADK
jgi:hypothetical protein